MSVGVLLSLTLALLGLGAVLSHAYPRAWLAATLAACASTLGAALLVLIRGTTWEWTSLQLSTGGHALHFQMDGLAAWFTALLAVIGAAGATYSADYWSDQARPRSAARSRLAWTGILLCMGAVFTVANGLHFLIAWELFAVANWVLLTLDNRHPSVRSAGWLYLAASHTGTLALFAFFTLLHLHTGSWDLGPMQASAELAPLFWLALFGFGLKAGVFPLHVWLPSTHANAPSHASALMSGVAIKLGVFGVLRFSGWLPLPAEAGWVVLGMGAASALLGIAFSFAQDDLKRLLAYCSVENIGIIFIGIGGAMLASHEKPPGNGFGLLLFCGALLHVWNHGVFKALLFLGAGSVLHATGTRDISRLGGLWRTMPWTTACFAIGALAVAGLPPLNGFASEWLVYLGLIESVTTHASASFATIPALLMMSMAGALALATFAKAASLTFLGAPRTQRAAHAHEAGPLMLLPMAALACLCVLLALSPALLWPAAQRVALAWNPALASAPSATLGAQTPEALVSLGWIQLGLLLVLGLGSWGLLRKVASGGLRRAPTWDCGYASPTARMQYTSGSFSELASRWFAWVLRPRPDIHKPRGVIPGPAKLHVHVPETVLQHLIGPVAAFIMRLSSAVRRRQHGHLQSYILYLLAGLIGLALVVASSAQP